MPDARPDSITKNIAYLKQALAINPLYDATRLLALRRQFLGLAPIRESGIDGPELREQRTTLTTALDRIRSKLWSSPRTRLIVLCKKLDTRAFPDLNALHVRLTTLVNQRDKFATLPNDPRFDPALFQNLKQILEMPAREATVRRLKFARSLKTRKGLIAVRKMIRLIEDAIPEVYELEEEWFDQLSSIPLPGFFK